MMYATLRVEPGFWLGDNITEAHPHQPARSTPALHGVGQVGHHIKVPVYSFPEPSCGKSELCGEE